MVVVSLFGAAPASAVAGFGDVGPGEFFTEPVQWLVDEELTTGRSPGCFAPYGELTRGEVGVFLHRLAGEPAVPESAANPFVDVQPGDFFYDAVLWLFASGLTTGTSPTSYSPDDTLTRGQFAAFLHRLEGTPAAELASLPFSDVGPGDFFYSAVRWLFATGLTTGVSPTLYAPHASLTRGEFATFVYRLRDQPTVIISPEHPSAAGCEQVDMLTWSYDGSAQEEFVSRDAAGTSGEWRLCEELVDEGRSECEGAHATSTCFASGTAEVTMGVLDPRYPFDEVMVVSPNGRGLMSGFNNQAIQAARLFDVGAVGRAVFRVTARTGPDARTELEAGPENSIQFTSRAGWTYVAGLQHVATGADETADPRWQLWVDNDWDADRLAAIAALAPGEAAEITIVADFSIGEYVAIAVGDTLVPLSGVKIPRRHTGWANNLELTFEAANQNVCSEDHGGVVTRVDRVTTGTVIYDDAALSVERLG